MMPLYLRRSPLSHASFPEGGTVVQFLEGMVVKIFITRAWWVDVLLGSFKTLYSASEVSELPSRRM